MTADNPHYVKLGGSMRKCAHAITITDPGDNPNYQLGEVVRCDCIAGHEGPHRNGKIHWRLTEAMA